MDNIYFGALRILMLPTLGYLEPQGLIYIAPHMCVYVHVFVYIYIYMCVIQSHMYI